MLYVGDSVGHTANLRIIENFSQFRIKSARAYSAVHDNKARWPDRNFENIVKRNLKNPGRDKYDVVVMTSPTVDISNLDTLSVSDYDYVENKVIASSNDMFKIAHRALTEYPTLRKVVIFEHPPRFYDVHKSKLVNLPNNTLNQLWCNSPFRNKIILGRHSLESSGVGAAHTDRFQDYNTGRYDGVHLLGPTGVRDYTGSVKNILMLAFPNQIPAKTSARAERGNPGCPNTCEQAQYQWRQARNRQTHRQRAGQYLHSQGAQYGAVKTQNRFSVFNQGN